MYEKDGEKYYVVDSHIHFWNGGASNQKNRYGAGFTGCFYDYQKNLSPSEWVWDLEKFGSYTEDDLLHDLFDVGYVDKGIFQPTYLTDFYTEGFNTTERNGALAEKHPSRLITNGAWDRATGRPASTPWKPCTSAGT